MKGLASYCKAETTFTFYFTILPLSRAFLSINNREMKSESGFSFAMASQPFGEKNFNGREEGNDSRRGEGLCNCIRLRKVITDEFQGTLKILFLL